MTIPTLPGRSAPDQKNSNTSKRTQRSGLKRLPSNRAAVSYLDFSYSDDEPYQSDDEEDCAPPYSPYGNGAADADDEGEGVVQYAQTATFRRPVVVQCLVGQSKIPIKEILRSGPPEKAGSWLNLDRGPSPVDFGGDDLSSEEGYDVEAEERLERRLAEDRALELGRRGSLSDEDSEHTEALEPEIQWSDVVYDESIVVEHLTPRHEMGKEEADEEAGAEEVDDEKHNGEAGADRKGAGAGAGEEEEEGEGEGEEARPNSAMSELDALVRESLLIAHDSSPIRPRETLVVGAGSRKRKVSFEKVLDAGTIEHGKKIASMGPSTPYPFLIAEEKDEDELYGFKVNVKATPERWEMSEFGGTGPVPTDTEKALKVLGLVEADRCIGLD